MGKNLITAKALLPVYVSPDGNPDHAVLYEVGDTIQLTQAQADDLVRISAVELV